MRGEGMNKASELRAEKFPVHRGSHLEKQGANESGGRAAGGSLKQGWSSRVPRAELGTLGPPSSRGSTIQASLGEPR